MNSLRRRGHGQHEPEVMTELTEIVSDNLGELNAIWEAEIARALAKSSRQKAAML